MYLVYRVAMPVTQNDEKAMLALIAKPSSPKRAGQTLAALDEYIELIQLGARCGIEVAKYSHLRETVRSLLKEAEGIADEERGDDLKDERRKAEQAHDLLSLASGDNARASFLAYLDELKRIVRRLIPQDSVAEETAHKGRERRDGTARQARETPRGLPKNVVLDGTEWTIEGLPDGLSTSVRLRMMEDRVAGVASLASKPPKGVKPCRNFGNKETGCDFGKACVFWHAKHDIAPNSARCMNCGASGHTKTECTRNGGGKAQRGKGGQKGQGSGSDQSGGAANTGSANSAQAAADAAAFRADIERALASRAWPPHRADIS